jgi:hypothetical protein
LPKSGTIALETGTNTTGSHVQLFWGKKKFIHTVPLNDSNIALMWSAPGNKRFPAFAAQFEDPNTVTDDDDDDSSHGSSSNQATEPATSDLDAA